MRRRSFIKRAALAGAAFWSRPFQSLGAEAALTQDWLARWEKSILGDERNRYCDKEMSEEIGWLISPFLNGFYYGYLATRDVKWAEHLADWADSWIQRGVKEPDGFIGWPKSGTGGAFEENLLSDSLLGEAMALRPVVLMAGQIRKTPSLKEAFGARAEAWLKLAGDTYEKWNSRGCWREVEQGGLWVVPQFGIDRKTGGWSEGYARRTTEAFSNPDNKENHIGRWMLAMHDVTEKAIYRERAEHWFRLMKSRLKTRVNGKYFVWNYWEPAGPWDYKPDGTTRHWVGVHPNGGYYQIDVEAIVAAFEHGVVFTREDIDRLIATNRDFMWNQQLKGAQFQRIDGEKPDDRWKVSPGVLWAPLVPYDATLKNIFLTNHNPAGWNGMVVTPWYLANEAGAKATEL